jgi:hypothetical protein
MDTRSLGRRAAVALVTLALVSLPAAAGWAVAEMEGAEAPAEAAEETAAAPPTGTVSRSAFTSAIADREPVDQVTHLDNDMTRIFFFTELSGLEGETVMHQWEHNGEVMAVVPFEVGGSRWRVYSSKSLDPQWLGQWSVRVMDGGGNELSRDSFTYTEAEPEAVPAAPAAPSAPTGLEVH